MSDERETVPVRIVFGFQITRVSDEDGALETTTYEPGQEVELEKEVAREQQHLNRVRIVVPEPAAADPSVDPVAEVPAAEVSTNPEPEVQS